MSRALDCRISPAAAAWLLAAATAAAWVVPLYDAAAYPPSTMQYDPEAMQRATDAVNAAAASDGVGAPRLTSRMAIVPYYTEAAWFQLPYTDLQGLTRYLSLNGITYMLLQHERLGGRPFGSAFAGGQTPAGFELLHRDVDADGQLITLHRFTPGATEQ